MRAPGALQSECVFGECEIGKLLASYTSASHAELARTAFLTFSFRSSQLFARRAGVSRSRRRRGRSASRRRRSSSTHDERGRSIEGSGSTRCNMYSSVLFDIAARERSPVAPIFATGPCPFVVTGRCTTAAVPSRLLSSRGCTFTLYQFLAGRARLNLHSLNGVVPSSPTYSPNSGIRMSAELKAWSDQKFNTRYIERQAGTDWGGGTNAKVREGS